MLSSSNPGRFVLIKDKLRVRTIYNNMLVLVPFKCDIDTNEMSCINISVYDTFGLILITGFFFHSIFVSYDP